MMKKIILDTLSLVVITVVAGLLLSSVHGLTEDTIAYAEADERIASYREVFDTAADFSDVENFDDLSSRLSSELGAGVSVGEAKNALDEAGNIIGVVVSATSANGYGGDVTLSVGIDPENKITGMKVTSMSESPGFGSHCQDKEFQEQFKGISGEVKYVSSGKSAPDEIDMISGATFTTKAVTEAVNAALDFAELALGGM